MRRQAKKFAKGNPSAGSALILTVVLTSLLAIVGVLFVMMARVNQIATSGISESRELDSAIETVIAEISEELVLDVPGVSTANLDYYDYPGSNDEWLASLEPYDADPNPLVVNPYWRQISDLYNKFDLNVGLQATIVPDYQEPAEIGDSNNTNGYRADADGDGVADSKWVELADITSSKGEPIYAAIRIVDNGGMLNVNTAYKFDPNDLDVQRINGSSQTQINLAALSQRGANGSPATAADKLQAERCGTEPNNNLSLYERNVVWRYGNPSGAYTPFDIGDELKLRNRYILNYNLMTTRIEELWERAYDGGLDVPRTEQSQLTDPCGWFWKTNNSSPDVNQYDYRHISTTYNMDRIINPSGGKMVNVNRINDINDVNSLYGALLNGLDPCLVDVDKIAAQIAVNLKDYRDGDSEVTSFVPDVNGPTYYGFERPCVYISELVHKFEEANTPPGLPFPGTLENRSYAIELRKPYEEDDYPDPNQWRLSIEGCPNSPFTINWSGTQHFHVMSFEHLNTPLSVDFNLADKDPNFDPIKDKLDIRAGTIVFAPGRTISLERRVGTDWISVDSVTVKYGPGPPYLMWAVDGQVHSYQRDINPHKCIRRLWDDSFSMEAFGTLGGYNAYTDPNRPEVIQAHPVNTDFTNVGEIGMVFRKGAYYRDPASQNERIGYGTNKTEEEVRVDLAKPEFQQLFKYLTVIDPYYFYLWDPNYIDEKRIKGRININTAPWYVIAQLPWVQHPEVPLSSVDRMKLAQAIVAYRDKLDLSGAGGPNYYNGRQLGMDSTNPVREDPGFASIAESVNVTQNLGLSTAIDPYYDIRRYARDYNPDGTKKDQQGFPDLTPGGSSADGAENDFEERDVIFARISNLVTVRSDVFTAYILVRIGTDGPQKRVIAILDRSDVYSPTDRVKIVAVHPVADPR